jgi:hypothetical protein
VEGSCKLGNELSGSIKCWELPNGCIACGLSSGTQLHRVSQSHKNTEYEAGKIFRLKAYHLLLLFIYLRILSINVFYPVTATTVKQLLHSRRRLLVKCYVPSSPIVATLMMGALSSSETSVLTRVTRRNIPDEAILQEIFP